MLRRALTLAICLLLVLPTLVYADPPSERLLTLGDSLMRGVKVSAEGDSPLLGGPRPRLYQRLADAGRVIDMVGTQSSGPATLPDKDHEGHNGYQIDQIRAGVPGWLTLARPTIVVVLAGTNDVAQRYELATAPGRLGLLLDTIHQYAPAAMVYVSTLPPINGSSAEVQAFNASVKTMISARVDAGRPEVLVDLYAVVTPAMLTDGVHLTAEGDERVADAWFAAMQPITVPGPCNPRPPIRLATTTTANGWRAVVTPGYGVFTDLRFGAIRNGTAYLSVAQPTTATIDVTRTAAGVVYIPFVVVDGCGEWQTFVGSGP